MPGKRKPLLRSLPSGNDTHGRYISGTPMNRICASLPVPSRLRVSRMMLSACNCQEVSFAGQVVNMTPRRRITPWGVSVMSRAAPRAARWRRANWADLNSAPAAAE